MWAAWYKVERFERFIIAGPRGYSKARYTKWLQENQLLCLEDTESGVSARTGEVIQLSVQEDNLRKTNFALTT